MKALHRRLIVVIGAVAALAGSVVAQPVVVTGTGGLAQEPPETILTIESENFVQYQHDNADYAKFATDPGSTTGAAALNFAFYILMDDIVSVNGKPAKGSHVCRAHGIGMVPNPTPGQAIGDVNFPVFLDCMIHILQPDGTPVGAITYVGRATGPRPPGAPLGQKSGGLVVTGGNGPFLGARGQAGELHANSRRRSVTEDPSRRRVNGGGQLGLLIHLIPMVRPEIVLTPSGPAVFHSDFSQVTAARPAKAGEVLILKAKGLGPTRPGIDPGQPFPTDAVQEVNSPVEVTVNGNSAEVINNIGWPGLVQRFIK